MLPIPTEFNTPLEIPWNVVYSEHMRDYLVRYKNFASLLLDDLGVVGSDRDSTLKDISDSILFINDFFISYRNNRRDNAVKDFNLLMDIYKKYVHSQLTNNLIYKGTLLYRMRADNIIKPAVPRYELFHIPYNLRNRANNLRFNSHGIPCLYCCSDLTTAWMEMHMPCKNRFYKNKKEYVNIGLFKTSSDSRCVDFSLRNIEQLINNITKPDGVRNLTGYLKIFPLVANLHVIVEFPPNEPTHFRKNYVIPSLIMNWFINESYSIDYPKNISDTPDAIKYSSVKNNQPNNFCFFTKRDALFKEQYCSGLEKLLLDNYHYYFHEDISAAHSRMNSSTIPKVEKYMISQLK